ncbi:MAG: META domain-containing protein [Alistipes sp.]|nr:META domain-containing protein [Alistipes sp.]
MKIRFAMTALLLSLAACGVSEKASLDGTAWKLVSMTAIPDEAITAESDAFALEFDAADTMVYGRTNCNRFFGKYTATEAGELHFGNMAATRMACPEMQYESDFLEMLDAVDRYDIHDGQLTFYANSVPLAAFRPMEKNESEDSEQ